VKIKQLDQITIDKIAAGEVIERPASVVKELVENSIDAGASSIIVSLKKSGKELIQVIDNGEGIAFEDLKIAVQRHTTSKITKLEDLYETNSYGFRGEALSSICSVSQMELKSRPKEQEIGGRLVCEGGQIIELYEIGMPHGTEINVRNLFYNVPARKKHLASDFAELGQIITILTKYALVHPEIKFTLENNNKKIFSYHKTSTIIERIAQVLDKDTAKSMVEVNYEEENLKITGATSKPSHTRASRTGIHIFVNNRPIVSERIATAIEEGYGTLLMVGRHPISIINIEIDPAEVDVNVHPTKKEVRFLNERKVANAVITAIANAFKNLTLTREYTEMVEMHEIVPEISDQGQIETEEKEEDEIPSTASRIKMEIHDEPTAIQASLDIGYEDKQESVTQVPGEPIKIEVANAIGILGAKRGIKVIGQVNLKYIIAADDDNIIIIDQHAAHERIMYEKIKNTLKSRKLQTQELLSPITIELSLADIARVQENIPFLNELGFDISYFGGKTFIVNAVPLILSRNATEKDLKDLLDELSSFSQKTLKETFGDELIKLTACHSAIRWGDALTKEQMVKLINELAAAENPYSCPHGRPTILVVPLKKLERRFGRIQ